MRFGIRMGGSGLILLALAGWLSVCGVASAQHLLVQNQAVGGISIDPAGVVSQSTNENFDAFKKERDRLIKNPGADVAKASTLRMISLKGLEAGIQAALKNNGEVPEELRFLGGLTRIQYVFVLPEQHDIILAGPAEGWRLDGVGNIVGVKTGRPVILLDDLLVALRYVKSAQGSISCSIDPTAEGRRNLEAYLAKQRIFSPEVIPGMEKALGPQVVSIKGVPDNSHFARVLIAADFRMKRLAMNLEAAPIKGLPSFVEMFASKGARLDNMMPRWWLAMNYQPLGRSEDGLSFELRGQGVKAMTEDEFVAADGKVTQTGKVNPVAKQWADNMTAHYEELSTKEVIFGELRNLMDLSVVAALIGKEDLLTKVGAQFPLLCEPKSDMMLDSWNPAKTIATQASFVKKGREYIITASGGVQLDAFAVLEKTEKAPALGQTRAKAIEKPSPGFWWN